MTKIAKDAPLLIAGSHLTGFGRVRRAADRGGYQILSV
jgi:hypothetical protein